MSASLLLARVCQARPGDLGRRCFACLPVSKGAQAAALSLVWCVNVVMAAPVGHQPTYLPILGQYARGDGSLTVAERGDFVDPYFGNKALLIAWEGQLNVGELTKSWLLWLLPRQRGDGGFDRFCLEAGHWRACKPADADDSSVATFLELSTIYQQHRRSVGLPESTPGLNEAQIAAKTLLMGLRQSDGIYRAFKDRPIAYLMDNTEVYASLMVTGRKQAAADLKQAVSKVFYRSGEWQPANVEFDQRSFYPHALAPAYRWHTGFHSPAQVQSEFGAWARQWGDAWLYRKQDEYAWGLIGWGAREVDDQHWVRCWRFLHRSPSRARGWTVLDESVDLSLAHLGVEPVEASCATLQLRR